MTSRSGSLLVAVLLAAIVVVAGLIIWRLVSDGENSGSSLISLSLRDGDLVGLGLSTEIGVIARDENAVTQVSLLVEGALVTQAIPVQDEESGDYRAALIWKPERIGDTPILVRALTSTGELIERSITVAVVDPADLPEAEDDAADAPIASVDTLPSSPAVTILSPQPGDQVAPDTSLTVLVRGPAEVAMRSFILEVNGTIIVEEAAIPRESGGYQAALAWQPSQEGPVTLRVRGTTEQSAPVAPAEVIVQVASGAATSAADETSSPEGRLAILAPNNNDDIAFTENVRIPISVLAENVGRLTSLDLFVNTVSLSSLTPAALSAGLYRVEISFEPPEPGLYALEVVAFAEDGSRFSDQIVITVGGETTPPDEEGPPDLAPTGVGVSEGNAIEVTLSNVGDTPIESQPVVVSVQRSSDNILIDETTLDVTLPAGGSQVFILPIRLTEALQITLTVDTLNTIEESNEDNNTITTLFQPAVQADLVAQDLVISASGQAIIRIANVGDSDHVGTITVLLLLNGETIEQLGFSGLLASQGSLTLTGNIVVSGTGQLSAVIDPEDLIAEASEGNNAITIQVGS